MNKYATLTLLAVILLLTMFNNLEHIAQVYHAQVEGTSHSWLYEWIESYSVVITFDLLVIALIIAGKVTESVTVAWLIFALNLIFFDAIGKGYNVWYFFGAAKVFIASINAFISTVIFSGLFAWSIHKLPILFKERLANNKTEKFWADLLNDEMSKYGMLYHEKLNIENENIELKEHNQELKKELEEQIEWYKKQYEALENTHKNRHEEIKTLGSQIIAFQNLFTCDCCQTFIVDPIEKGLESSIKALRAHRGVCIKQPKNIQS